MASKATFISKFNSAISGLFKDNITKDIGANDARELVSDVAANIPFTDDDSYIWASPCVDLSGTSTMTATLSPAISSYANKMSVKVKATDTSDGVVTWNFNSVGAKKVFINPTTQAGSGDLIDNQIYSAVYDTALDGGSGGFLIVGGATSDSLWQGAWSFPGDAWPTAIKGGQQWYSDAAYDVGGEFIEADTLLISRAAGTGSSNFIKKV